MVWYCTVQYSSLLYCTLLYCLWSIWTFKSVNGVSGQMVPRVSGDKWCQGSLGQQLRRSTQGQGFLKNSFQIELDSWRRSILFMFSFNLIWFSLQTPESHSWCEATSSLHLWTSHFQTPNCLVLRPFKMSQWKCRGKENIFCFWFKAWCFGGRSGVYLFLTLADK